MVRTKAVTELLGYNNVTTGKGKKGDLRCTKNLKKWIVEWRDEHACIIEQTDEK